MTMMMMMIICFERNPPKSVFFFNGSVFGSMRVVSLRCPLFRRYLAWGPCGGYDASCLEYQGSICWTRRVTATLLGCDASDRSGFADRYHCKIRFLGRIVNPKMPIGWSKKVTKTVVFIPEIRKLRKVSTIWLFNAICSYMKPLKSHTFWILFVV